MSILRKWSSPMLLWLLTGAALYAGEKPRSHDWPQWRGPHRDAISAETGLLPEWSKEGPPLFWKAQNLGRGHAAVAVAGGRLFALGARGMELFVVTLDETTGKEIWATRVGGPWKGDGPNSTPAVDGDRLYVILPQGEMVCLDVATGRESWRRNLTGDFGARFPGRGMSESPLVDGAKVICTPGGEKASLVALDKMNGKTIWQAQVPQGDRASYASPITAEVSGRRQYIQFMAAGVVGVGAEDGRFLWRFDKPANGTAICSTPLFADDYVFAASAYGRGGALARLSIREGSFVAEEVYFTRNMKNHHGGFVLVDGYLYGAHGGNEDAPRLVCLEFRTGKLMWEERRAGKGSIAYADGRLYYRNEQGPMLLLDASPKGYIERGRFNQPDRQDAQAWAHPVIANGKLYLRDQNVLLCFDIKLH